MRIKREDLDVRRIDFADVTTGKQLPLIHPGEILRGDFLVPMKISVYTLAHAIKVPRSRVNDIVQAAHFAKKCCTNRDQISKLESYQYYQPRPEEPAAQTSLLQSAQA